ncbi:hypothetical protein SARC_03617 [Sphaeroforma arctica JP610]|uniref:Plasma membrane proteolipid 3 n=1 Tax=Sphaeroforma arctica JP610 TaxID=667725 RepID=A0A0L0G5Q8_9EUKA|nr:hypothetical protein SARC_03617 [Sphaeroforma arctica JP610]KNC84161.1 hypothetical protein SARC_03617 [Sphaeroforma arctica JP610]|eukprot:XP_014158063.1 hypothetical protein SARC_03617 [Sphaeroforma arctica JP610]
MWFIQKYLFATPFIGFSGVTFGRRFTFKPLAPAYKSFSQHTQTNKQTNNMDLNQILLIVLAIFLPPVAVLMHEGCNGTFALNCLFCLLAWLPGIVHALYVITQGGGYQRM